MTLTPAFVVGKYLDFIAWNPLAAALRIDIDKIAPHERNCVRMLFADPRMRDFYDDWEGMARTGVALLRMQAVDNPKDPRLANLVGELSVGCPLFRQWWASRHVASQNFGSKIIHHPKLGELTLDWDRFYWSGDPRPAPHRLVTRTRFPERRETPDPQLVDPTIRHHRKRHRKAERIVTRSAK
ncbi:hypothetical protein [Streptomyces sp. NPDC097610]|uniref:MmyB family transcriptional regulator n=1 Tax=Streptomyces sp. NPDC097610 TaxID=3157227 RepID=UPI003317D0EC